MAFIAFFEDFFECFVKYFIVPDRISLVTVCLFNTELIHE